MRLARVALGKRRMQHAREECDPLVTGKPGKPRAHGLVHAVQHLGTAGERDRALCRLGGTCGALVRLGVLPRDGSLAVRADRGDARVTVRADLRDLGVGVRADLRDLRRSGIVDPFCNVHNAVHFSLRH